MYLFVFIWVPSLQEVSPSFPTVALPLGYIFSSFMISMMLGSILYTAVTSYTPPRVGSHNDSSLTLHAKLSSLVCAVSALALAVSTRSESERMRFWAFCAFEACVGTYYPVQGMLRGTLISNEHRATVSISSPCSCFASFTHAVPFSFTVIGTFSRAAERLRRGVSHDGCLVRPECSPFCKFVDVGVFGAHDRLCGRFESGCHDESGDKRSASIVCQRTIERRSASVPYIWYCLRAPRALSCLRRKYPIVPILNKCVIDFYFVQFYFF